MEKMMMVFSLVLAMVLSACGGDDTDPMPEPDGQVATSDGLPSTTDGTDPATDSDPSLPECKADASKIETGLEGNASHVGVYAVGNVAYAVEPKAKVEMRYKTYYGEMTSNDIGMFGVQIFLSSPNDIPKSVTLTISKKTCRTKTIELAVRRY